MITKLEISSGAGDFESFKVLVRVVNYAKLKTFLVRGSLVEGCLGEKMMSPGKFLEIKSLTVGSGFICGAFGFLCRLEL